MKNGWSFKNSLLKENKMTSELEDDELVEDDDLPEDDNWSDWRNDVTSTISSVIDRVSSIKKWEWHTNRSHR